MLVTLISFSKKLECKRVSLILKKQSVSYVVQLQEAMISVISGELKTLERNISLPYKSFFLDLTSVDWTTYLFKTVFRKPFQT